MAMNHQRVREAFDACRAIIQTVAPETTPVRSADPTTPMTRDRPAEFFSHLAFCCETGKQLATEAETAHYAAKQMVADQNAEAALPGFAGARSKMDKAMRWLGFVQGALWTGARVPLEELKKMNMPPEEAFSQERV